MKRVYLIHRTKKNGIMDVMAICSTEEKAKKYIQANQSSEVASMYYGSFPLSGEIRNEDRDDKTLLAVSVVYLTQIDGSMQIQGAYTDVGDAFSDIIQRQSQCVFPLELKEIPLDILYYIEVGMPVVIEDMYLNKGIKGFVRSLVGNEVANVEYLDNDVWNEMAVCVRDLRPLSVAN